MTPHRCANCNMAAITLKRVGRDCLNSGHCTTRDCSCGGCITENQLTQGQQAAASICLMVSHLTRATSYMLADACIERPPKCNPPTANTNKLWTGEHLLQLRRGTHHRLYCSRAHRE